MILQVLANGIENHTISIAFAFSVIIPVVIGVASHRFMTKKHDAEISDLKKIVNSHNETIIEIKRERACATHTNSISNIANRVHTLEQSFNRQDSSVNEMNKSINNIEKSYAVIENTLGFICADLKQINEKLKDK